MSKQQIVLTTDDYMRHLGLADQLLPEVTPEMIEAVCRHLVNETIENMAHQYPQVDKETMHSLFAGKDAVIGALEADFEIAMEYVRRTYL